MARKFGFLGPEMRIFVSRIGDFGEDFSRDFGGGREDFCAEMKIFGAEMGILSDEMKIFNVVVGIFGVEMRILRSWGFL